jgi:acyl dehydratase
MGGIIAHGTMSAALVWQALGLDVAAPGTLPDAFAGARLSIRFRRPVRLDDIVRGEACASGGDPGRYAVRVVRQDGETVIEGTLTLAGRPGPNNPPT